MTIFPDFLLFAEVLGVTVHGSESHADGHLTRGTSSHPRSQVFLVKRLASTRQEKNENFESLLLSRLDMGRQTDKYAMTG